MTAVELTTRKVRTGFMNGNICPEMFDVLIDFYSMGEVVNHEIDFEEAIYSDGFINAVERGQKPLIDEYEKAGYRSNDDEFHHLVYNDVCYKMYFGEEEIDF